MLEELPKYTTVWETIRNAKTVVEASDIVMLKYEKPATITDVMKERREKFGCSYWAMFVEDDDIPLGNLTRANSEFL